MLKKQYKATYEKLQSQIRKIKEEAKAKVLPIEADLQLLEQNFIQELLAQNPHIEVGKQYKYHNELVWITEILLNHYDLELKVKLNKVKKDGTNGMASANSYGTSINSLQPIKEQS